MHDLMAYARASAILETRFMIEYARKAKQETVHSKLLCDKFVSALHSAKAASSLSSLEDGDAESFESSSERIYSDDLDGSDAEICAAMIEEDRLKENEMLAPPLAADRQAAATDSLVRGSGSGKTKLAWVRSLMPAAVAGSKTLQCNRDIRGDTGIRWCGMLNMMWQQVPNFQ